MVGLGVKMAAKDTTDKAAAVPQQSPIAMRSLAKTALRSSKNRPGRDAIRALVKYGLLQTKTPMHHELVRITEMSDEEVSAVLQR